MVPGKLNRWKVGFVSSTALGSVHKAGAVKLTAAQAFVHAAGNLGLKTSLMNVRAQKVARGWTNLRVGGLRDLQRVRLGSYGLGHAAVPAYEAIVLDPSGSTIAFRTIVNARTGAILARTNLTDYFATPASSTLTRSRRSRSAASSPPPTEPVAFGTARTRSAPASGRCPASRPRRSRRTTSPQAVLRRQHDAADRRRHALLAGAVPLRTGRRRASGRLLRPELRLPGRRSVGRAADVHRHRHDRRQPASARLLGPLEGVPGHPAARDARCSPGPSRAPTRARRGAGARPRAATASSATSPRACRGTSTATRTRPTFTTSGNNNRAATSWTTTRLRVASGYMPVSTARDYSFPWTNDWNNRQCQRAARRPRAPSTTTAQRP